MAYERVVGVAQQARLVAAVLHPAVGNVLGAHPERGRIEWLARLVVQDEREAASGVAVDPRHHPGCVLDLDLGPVLSQLQAGAAVRADGHGAGIEPADGAIGDRLAVTVPPAVLAEAHAAGVDRSESRPGHLRRLAAPRCRGAA